MVPAMAADVRNDFEATCRIVLDELAETLGGVEPGAATDFVDEDGGPHRSLSVSGG
jgi:hypothetical protein